jgi:hypothetical protein
MVQPARQPRRHGARLIRYLLAPLVGALAAKAGSFDKEY